MGVRVVKSYCVQSVLRLSSSTTAGLADRRWAAATHTAADRGRSGMRCCPSAGRCCYLLQACHVVWWGERSGGADWYGVLGVRDIECQLDSSNERERQVQVERMSDAARERERDSGGSSSEQ